MSVSKQLETLLKRQGEMDGWEFRSLVQKGDKIKVIFVYEEDIYDGAPDATFLSDDEQESFITDYLEGGILDGGDLFIGLPLQDYYDIEVTILENDGYILEAEAVVIFTVKQVTPQQLAKIEKLKQSVMETNDKRLYNQVETLASSLGISPLFTKEDLKQVLDDTINRSSDTWDVVDTNKIKFIASLDPKLVKSAIKPWLKDMFTEAYKYDQTSEISNAHVINRSLGLLDIGDIFDDVLDNLGEKIKDEGTYSTVNKDGMFLYIHVPMDDVNDEDDAIIEVENMLEYLLDTDVYTDVVKYNFFYGVEETDDTYIVEVDVSDAELTY